MKNTVANLAIACHVGLAITRARFPTGHATENAVLRPLLPVLVNGQSGLIANLQCILHVSNISDSVPCGADSVNWTFQRSGHESDGNSLMNLHVSFERSKAQLNKHCLMTH